MSAAPKFTPGPWRMDVEGASYAYEVVHTSPRGLRRVVARVASKSGFREADTRLIAAAPELYSELAKAGERIETCIALMGRTWPNVAEKMSLQLADIRAALAKVSA